MGYGSLLWNGEEYNIVESECGDIFRLPKEDHTRWVMRNLLSQPIYSCEYYVEGEQLFLKQLNSEVMDESVVINNVNGKYIEHVDESELTPREQLEIRLGIYTPSPEMEFREIYGGLWVYTDINLPIVDFSGELLISREDVLPDTLPWLDRRAPWKVWMDKDVYVLKIKDGKVIDALDLSTKAAELRELCYRFVDKQNKAERESILAEWHKSATDENVKNFTFWWMYDLTMFDVSIW